MNKPIIALCSVILAWVLAMSIILTVFAGIGTYQNAGINISGANGANSELSEDEIISSIPLGYTNAELYNYQQYNVLYNVVKEIDRNLPTKTSNEGLDAYPQYGTILNGDSVLKAAINNENSMLNAGTTYDAMDADGNLYKNGQKIDQEFYKHTAADANYYGGLKDTQKAVVKEITFDDIKVADNNMFLTGLYAPAGEVIAIELSADDFNKLGSFEVVIGQSTNRGNTNDITSTGHRYIRMPYVTNKMTVSPDKAVYNENAGTYTVYVGSYLGGPIYLNKLKNIGKEYKITISNAVEYPHYILGVTTKEDWERLQKSTAPYIDVLVVDRVRLCGPAKYGKKDGNLYDYEQITKVAQFWSNVHMTSYKVPGSSSASWGIDILFDAYVRNDFMGGGVAVMGANFCINADSWMGNALNYEYLMSNGDWGNMHELNHHYQNFGLANGGEVTNNAVTLLELSLYTNISARRNAGSLLEDWLRYLDPTVGLKEVLNFDQKGTVITNAGTSALSAYSVLVHSITADEYISATSGSGNDNYFKALSEATKLDMTYYFTELLNLNLSENALNEVKSKNYPMFVPAAISYQTGRGFMRDGKVVYNQSARPYAVDFSKEFEIDFNKYLVLPEGFEFKVKSVSASNVQTMVIDDSVTKREENVYVFNADKTKNISRTYDVVISVSNPSVDFKCEDIYLRLQFQDINNPVEFVMPSVYTNYASYTEQADINQIKIIEGTNVDIDAMNETLFDNDLSTKYVSEKIISAEEPAEFTIDLGKAMPVDKIVMYSDTQFSNSYTDYGCWHGPDDFSIYAGVTYDDMSLIFEGENVLKDFVYQDTAVVEFDAKEMRYIKIIVTKTEPPYYTSGNSQLGLKDIRISTNYTNKMSVDDRNVFYSRGDWTLNSKVKILIFY